MTYATDSTEWPSAISTPASVKNLIDLFYSLADNPKITGETFASDVFVADAQIFQPHKTFKGAEEIKKFREGVWNIITSRRHEIRRAYVQDAEGTDYLLIGYLTNGLKNGKTVSGEFVCRVVVDKASLEKGEPRLKYMQVWADTAPLFAAMKEA